MPATVPVSGTVTIDGKPLTFGTVAFQPSSGQPAKGIIGPDGAFSLSTYKEGDGAAIGLHKVRVTCYESQNSEFQQSNAGEMSLGKLLIPRKYTFFDQSGLTAEVTESGENTFRFDLTSK